MPSKQTNNVWINETGDRPVVFRPGFQSKKLLFAIFPDHAGPLVVDKLLKKTKMTSHHYTEQGPNVGTIRKLSLRSNAAPHKAGATLQHRERETLQVMPHLPYSPDLFSTVREKGYKSCHILQPWRIQHLEGERLQVLPHSPYNPDLFSILR